MHEIKNNKMSSRRTATLINKILNLKKYEKIEKFDNVCTRIYILKLNTDDDELLLDSLDSKKHIKNLELVKVEKELIMKTNYSNNCKSNSVHGSCCPFKCCRSLYN